MEGGRSAWLKAVMAAKKPGMSLGDAMKAAKKTYKKGGMLGAPPMGGRRGTRRGKGKGKMMGGVAYGFTGGPYTGSALSDGNDRFPALADATWHGPSELLGGRRPRRLSKKEKKALLKGLKGGNGSQLAPVSTAGVPAALPLAEPSVAPEAHQTAGPVAPAPSGGRRRSRRQTKKAGRGYY
jgi:hypothetical protein